MELESTLELAVLVSGPGVDLLQFIGTESNCQLYLGVRNLYLYDGGRRDWSGVVGFMRELSGINVCEV